MKDLFRLDDIDREILQILQCNGRISNAELARMINLSQPAVHNRIKRLEKRGMIQRYAALLDREMVGFDLLCFVHITLKAHSSEQIEAFRKTVNSIPEVLECHHVTGPHDYILKVVMRNRKELEAFIVDRITAIAGVDKIQTSLVLREVKSTTAMELE